MLHGMSCLQGMMLIDQYALSAGNASSTPHNISAAVFRM